MTALHKDYAGWNSSGHLQTFDLWNRFTNPYFNFAYGCFAEQIYLNRAVKAIASPEILDVGCATGTTYRFLRNTNSAGSLAYRGVDLSVPAVEKARQLYPGVDFSAKGQERLMDYVQHPYDIVFSRDTVMHQTDPYGFLVELAEAAKHYLVLRLRTRDNGASVMDVQQSCQMHYDAFWMPYIVLNTEELLAFLKELPGVSKITLNRSYEVLGGRNFRYLPKELYFTAAGGAETALLIEFVPSGAIKPCEVVTDSFLEGHAFLREHKWQRYARSALDRVARLFNRR